MTPAGPPVGRAGGHPAARTAIKCVAWDIDNTLLAGTYLEAAGPPPAPDPGLLAVARELVMLPPAGFVDTLLDTTEAAAAPYGGLADDVAIVHLGWKGAQ